MDTLIAFKWPIAVLTAVVILGLAFRRPLAELIERANKVAVGKLEANFDAPATKVSTVDSHVIWNDFKVGHIYWLGYDLMYLLALLNLGGSPSHIQHGFQQSLKNLRELALPPTYAARLEALSQTYKQDDHDQVGRQIAQFRMEIGNLLMELQRNLESRA